MRRSLPLASLLLFLGFAVPTAAPEAAEIVLAHPGASYSDAIAAVTKAIIEDRFGVKARIVHATSPVVFKAMDANRGDMDVFPGVQLPNSQAFIDEYVTQKGTVVMAPNSWQLQQGTCTIKAVADKYGIKTVYDMTRPEIVNLTAKAGGSKGEFWVGAAEWNSTAIDKVRARYYGLNELYELTTSQPDLEYARVSSAIKTGTPIFWACDTGSNFVFPKDSIVTLSESPHDPAKWHSVLPSKDPNWYDLSVIETSWPPVRSVFVYAKHVQTDFPEVALFLEKINPTAEQVGAWTYATVTEKRDLEEFAKEWIKNNPAIVNAWLAR